MEKESLFYKIEEVAQLVGVSRETLWRWSKRDDHNFPKPIKVGRSNMYRKADIDEALGVNK